MHGNMNELHDLLTYAAATAVWRAIGDLKHWNRVVCSCYSRDRGERPENEVYKL